MFCVVFTHCRNQGVTVYGPFETQKDADHWAFQAHQQALRPAFRGDAGWPKNTSYKVQEMRGGQVMKC